MSSEHDQDMQDQTGGTDDTAGAGDPGAGGGGGAGELSDVLGNQEASFVSDEKKPLSTGTLIMAGLLLACGAGTYFMYNRSAPASVKTGADVATAQKTINEFLEDKSGAENMKDLLNNTKAVEQFRASPGKVQVPVDDLRTNPVRAAELETGKAPAEDVDAATAKRRPEAARAATLKSAQGLTLKFVMSGGKSKSCMIDDKTYREGQAVGEFTLEQINTDSVILLKDGLKYKLPLKK